MHYFKFILLSVLVTGSLGCSDFLDKVPSTSSNAPVERVEQLLALLDNMSTLVYEEGYTSSMLSDDIGLSREMFESSPSSFVIDRLFYFGFFTEGIASQAIDPLWTSLYSHIYTANLIIEHVDAVSGSESDKDLARVNAHFLRAYSYWVLLNTYCLPYSEANKQALGVPKKTTTDFETSLKRLPQQELYDLIEHDLEIAGKTSLTQIDPSLPWRVTQTTVHALRARMYLYMNQYDRALTQAEKALEGAPDLLDYNSLGWANPVSYPATDALPAQTLHYCETFHWGAQKFLFWKEWIYPRLFEDRAQWYMPSQELIGLYDQQNDLRFELFYVEHGNRRFSVPYDAYRYVMFGDGKYAVSGLTTAEILLIRAEMQVRTGSWQEGLQTLDLLRSKRFKAGSYSPVSAGNQQEALRIVLEERRRELPFTFRMYDIRRFSVNDTPDDDVAITRDFFDIKLSGVDLQSPKTYTVPVGSPLYALPINDGEIKASQGEIEQNVY